MKYKILFCRFGCRWMYPENAAGVAMKNECPDCRAQLDYVESSDRDIMRGWCEREGFPVPEWLS